jgi:chemotaxis signal transduction protein
MSRATAALHVIARVGSERFAFHVGDVEEVLGGPAVQWVPSGTPGLVGHLRFRDRTVRAFDGSWAFDVPRTGRLATALVLRAGDARVALVVDDVDDLAALEGTDVRPVPDGTDPLGVLRGVTFQRDGAHTLVSLVHVPALVARADAQRRAEDPPLTGVAS